MLPGVLRSTASCRLCRRARGTMCAHLNPVAERAGGPGSWLLPSVFSRIRRLCGLLVASSVQLAFLLPDMRSPFPVSSFLFFLPNEWRHRWGCERRLRGTRKCSVTHRVLRSPGDGTGLNSHHPASEHCGAGVQQPQVSLP